MYILIVRTIYIILQLSKFYAVINCYSRVIVAFNVMSKIAYTSLHQIEPSKMVSRVCCPNVLSFSRFSCLFPSQLWAVSCELSSKSPNPTLSMSTTFMTSVARPEQDIKYGWTYHSEKDCQRGDRGHTGYLGSYLLSFIAFYRLMVISMPLPRLGSTVIRQATVSRGKEQFLFLVNVNCRYIGYQYFKVVHVA